MKKAISTVIIILCTVILVSAQSLPTTTLNHNDGNYIDNLFSNPPKSSTLNLAEIGGTPFYTAEFKNATVTLKSGKKFFNVPVKVDLYNNEILFQKADQQLALEDGVEVSFLEIDSDSLNMAVFKAGYPPIDKNTADTYYKLEGGGKKIHLLRHLTKRLMQTKTVYVDTKKFEDSEDWYVYSSSMGIQKIKLNKKQVENYFAPVYPDFFKIVAQRDLNLSKKADIIKLVNLLDE